MLRSMFCESLWMTVTLYAGVLANSLLTASKSVSFELFVNFGLSLLNRSSVSSFELRGSLEANPEIRSAITLGCRWLIT